MILYNVALQHINNNTKEKQMFKKSVEWFLKFANQMQQTRAAMVVWNHTKSIEKTKSVLIKA